MKKIFTLITFALLLTFGAQAQNGTYNDLWEKCKAYLIDNQPVSAGKLLDTIEGLALEDGNQEQLLNAILFRYQTLKMTAEDEPREAFIRYAEAKLGQLDSVRAAILHVELGSCYAELLNTYKTKIKGNAVIAGDVSETAMRYWSQDNFIEAINRHLDMALQHPDVLKRERTHDHLVLFDEDAMPGEDYLEFEPTLFEFVFHRAANVYKKIASGQDLPTEGNFGDWWLPAESFATLQIDETASLTTRYLHIFQELIAYNLEVGNETALIYNDFSRLRFVKGLLQDNNAYMQALQKMVKRHKAHPLSADVALELVKVMLDLGGQTDDGDNVNYQEATAMCHRIVERHPDALACDKVIQLLDELYATGIDFVMTEVQLPDDNIPVMLRYRNLRHAYLKVVKISEQEWKQPKYCSWDGPKYYSYLRSLPVHAKQRIDLPEESDMNWHTAVAALQPLECGFYYLIVTPERNTLNNKSIKCHSFQVSRLGFIVDGDQTIVTIDRKTGKPIGEVTVEQCKRVDHKKTKVVATSKSGKDGKLKISRNKNQYFSVNLRKGDDVLLTSDYMNISSKHPSRSKRASYHATLFTDRAIYRPGQTVYYHGIVVKTKGDEQTLAKRFTETMYFCDMNSQIIEQQTVETDEFGSFSGSFVIPTDRGNGTFRLKFGISWDRVYEVKSIQVQEYKRPTFEVRFDRPKEQYKLNQTITLEGEVKAYAGFGLDGMECQYQVTRTTDFPWQRYDQSYPYIEPEQISFGTVETDANGRFAITFDLLPVATVKPELQPLFTYAIELKAISAQGETQSATHFIRAGYNEVALSSNLPFVAIDKATDKPYQIEVVNMSGEPARGRVTEKIYRYADDKRCNYFNAIVSGIQLDRKLYSDAELDSLFPFYGFYSNLDKTLVSEQTYTVDGQHDIEAIGKLPQGKYIIEWQSVDDTLVQLSEYFLLSDSRSNKMPKKALKWFEVDKRTAFPGDTLHISLGSSANDVTMWVKIIHNSNDIRFDQWIEVSNEVKDLPYVVTEKDRGTLYVLMAFAKENSFYSEAESIVVPYDNLDLDVSLATLRDQLEPGAEETWQLTVKDANGRPATAALLAGMYDASLEVFADNSWEKFNMKPFHRMGKTFGSFPDANLFMRYPEKISTSSIVLFNFSLPSDAPFFDVAVLRHDYRTWSTYSGEHAGRLKGTITDETGESVPFANVVLKKGDENVAGCSSDFDGNYDINPIQPGTYDLEVSCIGYNRFMLKNIVIPRNRITFYDVKMTSGNIHLNEVVCMVVDYEIPLISKDNTHSEASITSEEIGKLPVRSAEGVASSVGGRSSDYDEGEDEELEPEPTTPFPIAPRQNFDETAFFQYLKTDAEGNATLNFTLPDALTRWKMQMQAYTKDCKTGSKKYTFTASKPVMIMADMPRYMYDNDTLWFVANVINTGSEPIMPKAKLETFDAATMEPVDLIVMDSPSTGSGAYTIPMEEIVPGRSKEVRWKVAAQHDLDLLAFRFTAYADNFSDAEQHLLPVLSSEIFMTQTLPITVNAETEKTFALDTLMTTGERERTHSMTLNFSTNPVWYAVQALPHLDGINMYCAENAFYVFYANTLSAYISDHIPQLMAYIRKWKVESPDALQSKLEQDPELKAIVLKETPWVLQAKNVQEQRSQLAMLFDALRLPLQQSKALKVMEKNQNYSGGWSWMEGMPESRFITTQILTGLGKLEKMGALASLNVSNQEKVDKIVNKAVKFIENRVNMEYQISNESETLSQLPAQVIGELYALSFFNPTLTAKTPEKAKKHYLDLMEQHWTDYNYSTQAKMALTLYRNGRETTAKKIMQSLKECAQTGEHIGMYWPKRYFTFESDVATHANIMAAFAEIDPDDALLDQMRVWLLSKRRFDRWPSSASTLEATHALLMRGSDWFAEGKEVTLRFGETPINTEGGVAGTGFIQRRWNANEVTTDMRQLTVNNPTNHLVWGGLFRQYFVPIDEVKSNESGFTIKRELLVETVDEKGKELVPIGTAFRQAQRPEVPEPVEGPTLKVGDKITVKLTFTNAQDMSYVFVKDLRAAGFEPIEQISHYEYNDRMSYYQSNTDTDMEFFIEFLPKGTHQLEYSMFVTKEGYLNNGYALIQCQYAPEFSAYSDGMKIRIGE